MDGAEVAMINDGIAQAEARYLAMASKVTKEDLDKVLNPHADMQERLNRLEAFAAHVAWVCRQYGRWDYEIGGNLSILQAEAETCLKANPKPDVEVWVEPRKAQLTLHGQETLRTYLTKAIEP
jgi:hypothetical protein